MTFPQLEYYQLIFQAGVDQSVGGEELWKLAVRVTGLRFLLACTTSMGHQTCLTDSTFVSKLRNWACTEPKTRLVLLLSSRIRVWSTSPIVTALNASIPFDCGPSDSVNNMVP